MRCALLIPPLVALVALAGSRLAGQPAAADSVPPAAKDNAPPKARAISPKIAAKIAASVPKLPPPATHDDKTALPESAAASTDTPRNTIIRLPAYIVREAPTPKFKPRELLSPQGRLDLIMKRYPGLRIGSLPFLSNIGIGFAMLEEEERLERMREAADLMGLLRYGNLDPKGEIKAKMDQSFMRSKF